MDHEIRHRRPSNSAGIFTCHDYRKKCDEGPNINTSANKMKKAEAEKKCKAEWKPKRRQRKKRKIKLKSSTKGRLRKKIGKILEQKEENKGRKSRK